MANALLEGTSFPWISKLVTVISRAWRLPMVVLLAWFGCVGLALPAHAGGGSENLLLIVNPNDEPSLRIANAYIAARDIPANNILYLAPPYAVGFKAASITQAQFTSTYQAAVLNAIAARGLTNQIDYIGVLGHPWGFSPTGAGLYEDLSLPNALNQLTQFQNGMTPLQAVYRNSELCYDNDPADVSAYLDGAYPFTYTPGTNTAIHHSTLYTLAPGSLAGSATTAQWYMSGVIGYSGQMGITTEQVIQNLRRTATGDGLKPGGTVYFEYDTGVRAQTRSSFWPAIESWMSANNVSWYQENDVTLPKNRSNVRGAELGTAGTYTPASAANGSWYAPGAWSDNLTSDGGSYGGINQTKDDTFLLPGNGGTSGTIAEPLANWERFPIASLWAFQNDGSTLGEAYYKSVLNPDEIAFLGDLLSQAYADVPAVTITSGPSAGATVSGTISLGCSAGLSNPHLATGIAKLQLFVDGLATGSAISGSSGTFSLNTTTLTDGIHELRAVAYNNSQAASEGNVAENVVVNNNGQSVSVTGTNSYTVAYNQALSIPVSATAGTGPAITSVELQSYGRLLGSVSGTSGSVAINASQLAYGPNVITPAAVLSTSNEVNGSPITITRQFQELPGSPPTPVANQNPGFDYFYYTNGAATTLAGTTCFTSGTPNYTIHSSVFNIAPSTPQNMPSAYLGGASANKGLAIMVKASFTVIRPGEYSFFFPTGEPQWSSYSLAVDGTTVSSFDVWNGTTVNESLLENNFGGLDTLSSVYLLPGEHSLVVKLLQYSGTSDGWNSFELLYRGPDGNTVEAAAPTFYTLKTNVGPQ